MRPENRRNTGLQVREAMVTTINETSKYGQKYTQKQQSITASCGRLDELLKKDWNDPQVSERLIKEIITLQSLTLQLLSRYLGDQNARQNELERKIEELNEKIERLVEEPQ